MLAKKRKVIISLAIATLATIPVGFGVWTKLPRWSWLLIDAPARILGIFVSGNPHQPNEVVYFLIVFLIFFGLAYVIISAAELLLRYAR